MNLESTLKRKIKTIKLMRIELENENLFKTEIEDLEEITAELQPLIAEYVGNLSTVELVQRLGPDHWILTCEALDEADPALIFQGIEELLGVQE